MSIKCQLEFNGRRSEAASRQDIQVCLDLSRAHANSLTYHDLAVVHAQQTDWSGDITKNSQSELDASPCLSLL